MLDLIMMVVLLGSIGLVSLLIRWCFYQVEAEE